MSKALGALIATALLAVAAVPASADDPAGGCPVGYSLITVASVPPEGQAGATALDARGNNDGYICVRPFTNPDHPGQPFNGIDNRVQS
jgi:hypothetical protein